MDEEGKLKSLVSQSQLVKLLADKCHMGHWKNMGDLSINELGLGLATIVSVPKVRIFREKHSKLLRKQQF